jgi:hypothetical protein
VTAEPAPERTPPDDTAMEGLEQFAEESREFAEASLPLAVEILPDDAITPVTAEDGEEFTISREQVSPETSRLVADATNGGGAVEHVVQFEDEAVAAEGLRERLTEIATTWALMYPLANWPWPGRTLVGVDAEHLDTIARDIAAAWGTDIADRMLAALADDPGDLPVRMATELERHFSDDPYAEVCDCGAAVANWRAHQAEAVASVRWEHAAHLAARLAESEARAEHAEGELSSLRDHCSRWETEHAEVERLQAKLAEAKEDVEIGDEKIGELNGITIRLEKRAAHSDAQRRRADELEAERDLLAAKVEQIYAVDREAMAMVRAERDTLKAKLVSLQALADRCREKDWAYAAGKVATIERVRTLHPRDDSNPRGPWCNTCLTVWPCATARALASESHEDAPLDRFTAGLRMMSRAVADAKSATRQDFVLTGPETTPDAPTGGED